MMMIMMMIMEQQNKGVSNLACHLPKETGERRTVAQLIISAAMSVTFTFNLLNVNN